MPAGVTKNTAPGRIFALNADIAEQWTNIREKIFHILPDMTYDMPVHHLPLFKFGSSFPSLQTMRSGNEV